MPRGCKWIDKGHFCKHTHRAMYKNIFKGTWHFVSVDRFETHAELVYKDIVTNKMVLSIFRHHTCFYRSRRLLSIFSKGITSALTWHCQRPNYAHQSLALTSALCRVDYVTWSSTYRGWWVAQTLLHPQTLCCATNTLCFPQILCVCHTPLFPIPKQKSKAKLPNHAQTLLHPQTLCCATNTLCFPQILCVCHTHLFPI